MPHLTTPIVGSHFRPPAKLLLQWLPAGTELSLEPEPSNPYDPNAVAVFLPVESLSKWLHSIQVIDEESDLALAGCGSSFDLLTDQCERNEPLHLGYLPASLKTSLGDPLNTQVLEILAGAPDHHCSLTFSPEGKPMIRLEY